MAVLGGDEQAPVVGRRALIKRATAAGAVAWTAPIIIDSLASPAAAATAPLGANSFTVGTNTTSCLPVGYPAANSLPAACITPTTYTGSGPVMFSVTGGCSCTFTAASSRFSVPFFGNQCNGFAGAGNPTITPTTVTFPILSVSTYTSFKFVLTCG